MAVPGRLCQTSTAPTPATLLVQKQGGLVKTRVYHAFAAVSATPDIGFYISNLSAMVRAVKERIFYVKMNGVFQKPPNPATGVFEDRLKNFATLIDKLARYTTPLEPSVFADQYVGRRKAVYQKAAIDNRNKGFDPKTSRIQMFVKTEKTNFTSKPDAVPRAIQPRNPRYLIETGRYIKPIEKQIYKNINKTFKHTVVFKGLNAERRGKVMKNNWDRVDDPVAVGLDAKRFDQHVSVDALRWEHQRYLEYYPRDKHFRHLMSLQLTNTCYGRTNDGFIKYKTRGKRMSGDSNTSLGNVTLMCGMAHAYLVELGLLDCTSFCNDGDDCVVILPKKHLKKFVDNIYNFFITLGFQMTVEDPVYELEHIEFCQSHPVFNGDRYVMVRDPRVTLSKDAISVKPIDKYNVAQMWCQAVGTGGLSLVTGIPVLQAYYSYYKRIAGEAEQLSDPTLEGGFQRLSRGMSYTHKTTTPEARFSFWLAFGMSPSQQIELEKYYDRLVYHHEYTQLRFVTLPM